MYIKSVVIDGFKSYGRRTEINGFDSEFNAITGLNGTGKSNILDSICFVLGISNLGQVRATSLQDLVYKSGQAGVTKATVTLVFDNLDKNQCPLGFEHCNEISVTRQIVVGGKNKYLINGKNVQNKKVQDLFCSVQLNVNNPNFLIMQGRITKVLNMKPNEILSMVEEAAGTSLYETKKEQALKMIEKKDSKLAELNTLIKEEVEPKLDKLRKERAHYIDYQKICREIEHLTRIYISFRYLKFEENVKNCEATIQTLTGSIQGNNQKIKDNIEEAGRIEEETKVLQTQLDQDSGGALGELEAEMSKLSKAESATTAKRNGFKENVASEQRKVKQLQKNLKEDEAALAKKEAEMQKVGSMFEDLKTTEANDAKEFDEAQKRFEAVSSGLFVSEDGAASLQDMLIRAKEQVSTASTTLKQSEMELKHNQKLISDKQKQANVQDSAYVKEQATIKRATDEIQRMQSEIGKINYQEGTIEGLQSRKNELNVEMRQLKSEYQRRGGYRFDFQYQDPEPNFDRSRVKGMLGTLLRVKDSKNFLALSTAAGGHLYSIVTDNERTGKAVIERGQLQSRVTIMPLNKVKGSAMHPNKVAVAQRQFGAANVAPALSMIEYDRELEPAMALAFGSTLICKDLNVAKAVAYHPQIMARCITLDGDVVSADGTLSGGSAPKGGAVLQEIDAANQIKEKIRAAEHELREISHQVGGIEQTANRFEQLKGQLSLKQNELEAANNRLGNTTFKMHQQELDDLKQSIETLKQKIVDAKESHGEGQRKVKDIEAKLSDAKGYREREMKNAEDAMKKAKKKSDESSKKWKKHEQEYETLRLSIEDLKNGITNGQEHLVKLQEEITNLETEFQKFSEESSSIAEQVNEMKRQIDEQKRKISEKNKEIKQKMLRKDRLLKQNQDLELEIKKQENEIGKVKNDNKSGYDKLHDLENKYPWISEDKEYFGVKNTRYDYSKDEPEAAGRKLKNLTEQKDKMSRNINEKAMMLLEREEEMFNQVIKRKERVEQDKAKILKTIINLDERKKKELKKAVQEVDANFGGIFSSILPGTEAKLVPPPGQDFLKGLEVKIGFNGLWKESLTELSGGQRSLVALSLILAMLKYKPAPLYILDEVDAALDLSHTQNIGNMLKHHFTNSQFIIVSLKDGMFNNANVLFRTKFVDGMSAVTRTVNPNLKR